MNKNKILVVDDETNIVELLKMNLESSGYEVIEAYTGMEAVTKADLFSPDLILLDLMLPDADGIQICKMIRKNVKTEDIPIIMITAKSQEEDKVQGLNAGADDYITKPFGISELEARIKTVLRRSENRSNSNIIITERPNILTYSDLILDPDKYEITHNGSKIDFTLSEFYIIKKLMENENIVTTRESLLDLIGVDKSNTDSRTIDVHIRNIRRKLEEDGILEYIETIRGIGYKLK